MAKEKERRTAHILYVDQGKTAKEVAELIGVAEKTIGEWVLKNGWKEERAARQVSPVKRAENIKMIILNLSEDRLRLDREIRDREIRDREIRDTEIRDTEIRDTEIRDTEIRDTEKTSDADSLNKLRDEVSRIDDAVSKWNKTLENIEKENRVSLSTYLNVMDQIFQAMRYYDTRLFMSTIEFQEHHIHKISLTQ